MSRPFTASFLPLLAILTLSIFQTVALSGERNTGQDRKEPSIPERLAILHNKTGAHPKDRSDAAQALGHLTNAGELRDQRVVEALCKVADDATDDLFVRISAMTALGELQFNVFPDDYARARYAVSFIGILQNDKEDVLLRARATQILGRTMSGEQPLTKKATITMGACAQDRHESLLVRVRCVDALATIGAVKEIIDLVGTVLPQRDLDPLLQERVLKALADVLSRAEIVDTLRAPDQIRLKDLFLNPNTPVEIRIVCMRALAVFKRAGQAKSVDLLPEIRRILKQAEDATLIMATVDVVGILDETALVPLLLEAYRDFFDKENVARPADVQIRTRIVRTLGGLVSAQATRKRPDGEAIRQTAELFLAIIDPAKENLETANVREEAIFALRYLYPKKPEFQRFHQPIAERLIVILREAERTGTGTPETVIDTLTIITRYPGEGDLRRWEKWYEKTYGQAQVVKSE